MSRILVAILAAGESKRMGRPKLCLPWGKTTILGHVIGKWRQAGAHDILVVHPQATDAPVVQELERLGVPAHERTATSAPERGMMGSVVTAASRAIEIPTLSHLVIALGDQPQLRTDTLRSILGACGARPDSILRISHRGRPGHPLALPSACLVSLAATPAATLRDFLSQIPQPPEDLTCSDSGVLLDIDTPDEYAEAFRAAKPSQPIPSQSP